MRKLRSEYDLGVGVVVWLVAIFVAISVGFTVGHIVAFLFRAL